MSTDIAIMDAIQIAVPNYQKTNIWIYDYSRFGNQNSNSAAGKDLLPIILPENPKILDHLTWILLYKHHSPSRG